MVIIFKAQLHQGFCAIKIHETETKISDSQARYLAYRAVQELKIHKSLQHPRAFAAWMFRRKTVWLLCKIGVSAMHCGLCYALFCSAFVGQNRLTFLRLFCGPGNAIVTAYSWESPRHFAGGNYHNVSQAPRASPDSIRSFL